MSEDEFLWWGEPWDAGRCHIFEGDGVADSLCGNWMLGYDGVDPAVDVEDEFRDGKDCKECAREAGVLEDE